MKKFPSGFFNVWLLKWSDESIDATRNGGSTFWNNDSSFSCSFMATTVFRTAGVSSMQYFLRSGIKVAQAIFIQGYFFPERSEYSRQCFKKSLVLISVSKTMSQTAKWIYKIRVMDCDPGAQRRTAYYSFIVRLVSYSGIISYQRGYLGIAKYPFSRISYTT